MNGNETRGITGTISELLKNKAVLEAIIAGIGAFSAASKVKGKSSQKSGSDGTGVDLSAVLGMLPQILPLLGLLSGSEGGIFGVSSPSAETGEALPVFAEAEPEADGSEEELFSSETKEAVSLPANTNVSYANKTEMRENLLVALRPFLSESRAAAADAIIQVNRISGLFA